jgi:hypothetical protein
MLNHFTRLDASGRVLVQSRIWIELDLLDQWAASFGGKKPKLPQHMREFWAAAAYQGCANQRFYGIVNSSSFLLRSTNAKSFISSIDPSSPTIFLPSRGLHAWNYPYLVTVNWLS